MSYPFRLLLPLNTLLLNDTFSRLSGRRGLGSFVGGLFRRRTRLVHVLGCNGEGSEPPDVVTRDEMLETLFQFLYLHNLLRKRVLRLPAAWNFPG